MSTPAPIRRMSRPLNAYSPPIPLRVVTPAQASDGLRPPADLITPAEAATQLRVTPKVLERWRYTGEGPLFIKFSSKTIRYRTDDIDAFVAERVRASTAAA